MKIRAMRVWLWVFALAAQNASGQASTAQQDPYPSAMWSVVQAEELGTAAYVFDPRVVVTAPPYAEDAMSVPLQVDASALQSQGLKVERIIVSVDRNPIRKIIDYEPMLAKPSIAVRFKLEQSSPVRALVKTSDGMWHVGSTLVEASGGGCTVSGASRKDGSWQQSLLQVQAKFFPDYLKNSSTRLRIRTMHPMDTGLVAGIPAFYLEELRMQDAAGSVWWKLKLFEPVAENPLLSLDFDQKLPSAVLLVGRDNNGGKLEQLLRP